MNRSTPKAWGRLALVALVASLLSAACASAPRPSSLQRVSDQLRSSETARLAESRPALVEEARQLTREADTAWRQGRQEVADLKSQMALQRLSTASNFETRDQIETRQLAMKEASGGLNREVELVNRERDALARFQQADARFQQVEQELSQLRADDKSAQAEARRALVKARKKQSEAIGAGGATAAEPIYNEGRVLLDAALEALNNGLYPESKQASDQAIERFDAAIKAAAASDVARRRKEQEGQAQRQDAAKAQQALEQAQTARAGAIAQRMPDKQPAAFKQGTYLLEVAQERLKAEDYTATQERAAEAEAIFRGAAEDPASPRGQARKALTEAEDARSGVLGAGLADAPVVRQADYNLQLARQAFEAGDFERTIQLAGEARKDYQLALGGVAGRGVAQLGPVSALPAAQPASNASSDPTLREMRREIDRKLANLQYQRASALGRQEDQGCPATFRELDALIDLSRQRLEAGDLTQAIEFTLRAEDALKRCPMGDPAPAAAPGAPAKPGAKPTPPTAAAKTTPAAGAVAAAPDAPLSPAEARKKAAATRAIAEAERSFARVSALKITTPERLEEPAMLLANARRWYEQQAWEEAQILAEDARKILIELDPNPPEDAKADAKPGDKPADKVAAKPGDKPTDKVAAKAADKGAKAEEKGALAKTCTTFNTQLPEVKLAQSAVGGRVSSEADEKRYRRAITSVLSAERMASAGQCQDAEFLLAESARVFEDLAQTSYGDSAPNVTAEPLADLAKIEPPPAAPAKTVCVDLNAPINDARLTQSLLVARVRSGDQEQRYRRADSLLRSAQGLGDKGLCDDGKLLVSEAAATLADLKRQIEAPAATPKADPKTPAQVDPKTPAKADTPATAQVDAAPVDPAARLAAVDAIGRAEVLRASRDHHKGSTVYETGSRLLREAQSALNKGRPEEATRLAQQATFAFESLAARGQSGGDEASEPWKAAYQRVLDVLVQQDRARSAASTAEEKETLERGETFMRRAESAWESKDYTAAERFARAGGEEFDAVLKLSAARRSGDSEAAEAKRLKELKALEDKNKNLADQNKALTDKNKTDQQSQAATQEAVQEQKRKQDALLKAAETLRQADVLRGRCVEAGCKSRDGVAWGRAEEKMTQAREAMERRDAEGTEQSSAEARAIYDKLLAMRATFKLPEGVKRLKLTGDKIELTPRITFLNGRAVLDKASLDSMDELAEAIRSNLEIISGVSIVGYTDNVGNDANNQRLSQQRADAVRAELIKRGIPASLLRADGKGELDPIADNKTADGRSLNRRVEIVLQLKP